MVRQIVRYCFRTKLLFLLSRFGILYVLNHNFHYFTYRNITKFCGSIHLGLVTIIYYNILSKLATVIYPLGFKK